jgi:hypothetical protein
MTWRFASGALDSPVRDAWLNRIPAGRMMAIVDGMGLEVRLLSPNRKKTP